MALHAPRHRLATDVGRARAWRPGQTVCIVARRRASSTRRRRSSRASGSALVDLGDPAGGPVVRRDDASTPSSRTASVISAPRTEAAPRALRTANAALPIVSIAREAAATQTSHVYARRRHASPCASSPPCARRGRACSTLRRRRSCTSLLLRGALFVYALDVRPTSIAAPGVRNRSSTSRSCSSDGAPWSQARRGAGAQQARDARSSSRAPSTGCPGDLLGVRRSLRTQLLARGVDAFRAAARAWFRSGTEGARHRRLGQALAPLRGEEGSLGFQVVANAATGGRGARRRPRTVGARWGSSCWPAPGRTWQLSRGRRGDAPALNDAGALRRSCGAKGERKTSRSRVSCSAKLDDAYVYSGVDRHRPRRAGVPLPRGRARRRASSRRASCRCHRRGRSLGERREDRPPHLTEPVRDAEGHLASRAAPVHELRALVAREMGESRVPHRIEVFPLRPRLRDGARGCELVSVAVSERGPHGEIALRPLRAPRRALVHLCRRSARRIDSRLLPRAEESPHGRVSVVTRERLPAVLDGVARHR